MNRIHTIFVAMFVLCLFVPGARSAPTTSPADQPIVTRVYDISDLLWQKSDYPAPPASDGGRQNFPGTGVPMFGGGGGMEGAQPPRTDMVENTKKLLQESVASETWKDNGGPIGSLRELGPGQLVVTQTVENQQKIAEVLQALRADRGRMVVIHAYWLLLDPGSVPAASTHAGGSELPIIDDKLIDAKNLYCGGQTMCFSGQTVHITSGRTRSIVTDLTPVVGTQAVGYDPQMERARSGVSLQVTPHLEPEGKDARCVVDLHSDVTELSNIDGDKIKIPEPATQPTVTADVLDRVNELHQQLQTTVRLPLGAKVLVGGMTLEPADRDMPGRQLYLVIQADAVK